MDEKEVDKIFKKAIKIYSIIVLIFIFPILVFYLFSSFTDLEFKKDIFGNIIYFFVSSSSLIFVPMILIYRARMIKYIESKKYTPNSKEYVRDIEIKYSPAIISLVIDLNTTVFKDYTAMILYLHWREFIEIEIENDEYRFIILKENIEELNPHEQYIFRCIKGETFDSFKFEKLVIEDARNMNLINCSYGKMKRTNKGEKEAVLWKGFKNYIHDYTLISEKDIGYIKILEEHIPYAIALDEAKSIEKFISKNEKYRNLIYNMQYKKE